MLDENKITPGLSKAKLEGGRLSQELIVFFWWGRHNPLETQRTSILDVIITPFWGVQTNGQ